jgi:hypothetical protein
VDASCADADEAELRADTRRRLCDRSAHCSDDVDEIFSCTTDGRSAVRCTGGRWELRLLCRGPAACALLDDAVRCDNSVANAGDPCDHPDGQCSADRTAKLVCRAGEHVLVVDRKCPGPDGCFYNEWKNGFCDDRVTEGAACETSGEVGCSIDRKSELVCQNGMFTFKQDCPRRDGCVLQDGNIFCQF